MKKRAERRVRYRGPAAVLVIDGVELIRDGDPVPLADEQVARLEADPTVDIEIADADGGRATTDEKEES